MKLTEMSDEELTHWILQAPKSDQLYAFPNEFPTHPQGATATVAYTRYTVLELAHEAARRLSAKSDWIPRPKIEVVADAVWVNDGFFMSFISATVGWQLRQRLMHLLGMEGADE